MIKKSPKKAVRKNHSPYLLNPLPTQNVGRSVEWRRRYAENVETEMIKPESFLPVTTGTSGRSPVCFTIKSIPHSLIDGRNIFLEVVFKIQLFDKQSMKWTDTVGEDVMTIANTYCSIFEDLNVSYNGASVENTQRDFAIKAYLQNLLFSSEGDRRTWLQSGLLAIEEKGSDHHRVYTDTILATNVGQIRRSLVGKNKGYKAYGRLLSDVLCCSEPLPDNINIGIKLFPAKSEACLIQNKKTLAAGEEDDVYRVEISDCSLYVPRISTKIITQLEQSYFYTNWKVLAYTHQSNQTNFKKDIAIGETLPQKAIVVFMPESSYNGDRYKSKLAFEHCNAVNVLMKCNHKHLPFINGYNNDWKNDLYHSAYVGLTTELGARDHPIDYLFYDNSYSIFGFDLTPNKTGDIALDEPLKGALELSVEFTPAPAMNLMVIVLLIYADRFTITKNGVYRPQ